ncbi:MAG: VOC family protein [Chloroflexota bacterium]
MGLQGIEVVSIPVSDQERAKRFYAETLGFNVVYDAEFAEGMRWVQLTPPGGGASITLMTWMSQDMPAGSLKELYVGCKDIATTYDALRGRGVTFSDEVSDTPYGRFAHFTDPDGNGWVLHEMSE